MYFTNYVALSLLRMHIVTNNILRTEQSSRLFYSLSIVLLFDKFSQQSLKAALHF